MPGSETSSRIYYKKIILTGGFLSSALLFSACGRVPRTVAPVNNNDSVATTGGVVLGAATTSALSPDESAVINVLAAKHGREAGRYQLHDARFAGNRFQGRYSYDNELSANQIWLVKSGEAWQLIFEGANAPACAQLVVANFPSEMRRGCYEDLNAKQISNFNECAAAGFVISSDTPRQCRDLSGNVFVEAIKVSTDKRYVSQNVEKCKSLDYGCQFGEKSFLDERGCGCQR